MTVTEALKLIDNVCAQVSLNRDGHVKIQEALRIVRDAVTTPAPENDSQMKGGKK